MAETAAAPTSKGLEGVVAGNTSLSKVEGQQGKLYYRGYSIHDLVNGSFEEVCYLLLKDSLPTKSELHDFRSQIARESTLPGELVKAIHALPENVHPMAAVRGIVSTLGYYDVDAEDNSPEANQRKAVRLIAQVPVAVAAYHRIRNGKEPLEYNDDRSLAWNFLYLLFGDEPSQASERLMDASLILHADHGFNASTFTCRVVAATLSDMHSGVTAAVGALKGPLHGGANERVMHMLQQIGEVEKAEEWLRGALERKEKIMGFGHRVYKTEDPRATHLRRMSEDLSRESGETKWFDMSQRLERVMLEEKSIYPNVDFYSASSYYMMGIPIDLYTPIFAVSRTSGWVAHFIEQQSDNRLIRPGANYTGELDLNYTPIDER